jgi:hypothetical protein
VQAGLRVALVPGVVLRRRGRLCERAIGHAEATRAEGD